MQSSLIQNLLYIFFVEICNVNKINTPSIQISKPLGDVSKYYIHSTSIHQKGVISWNFVLSIYTFRG